MHGARTSLGVAVLVVGGALLIAIGLGLVAGLRRGLLDVAITRLADVPVAETIATAAPVSLRPLGVAVAAPAILVAYVGQVVFGYRVHWLPVHGVHQGWVSYILPSVAVTAASVGYVALVTRRMLADILRELFVTAAVARGMSGRRIIAVHALRPALPSIVTLAAANLGALVASQIIAEGVYALPGIGSLIFDAIQRHDTPLLVPAVTMVIAMVIVANLIADIAAAVADPRLRDDR